MSKLRISSVWAVLFPLAMSGAMGCGGTGRSGQVVARDAGAGADAAMGTPTGGGAGGATGGSAGSAGGIGGGGASTGNAGGISGTGGSTSNTGGASGGTSGGRDGGLAMGGTSGSGVGWWSPPSGSGGTMAGTGGTGGTAGTTSPDAGASGGTSGAGGSGGVGGGGGSVTVPGETGSAPAPRISGGGAASNAPLAPGCTPDSARECPTANGACATGAGKTVTVEKFGTLCLAGETQSFSQPATTIEYLKETVNGQSYYRFRVTFNPNFVDNTYGASSIGWSPVRGHRFADLVGSDHTELQLFDAAGTMTLHFKLDYVTADASRACQYGTLGIKGGDGAMLVGNPAHVLAAASSLDRNLNSCGYCKVTACPGGDCRVNSPTTDSNFTTNPQAPNWDFRMVYEVWIAPEAFGASGFGKANISYVHASPAKGSADTILVSATPCPPNWNNPYTPPPGSGGSGGAGGSGGTGGESPDAGTSTDAGSCPVNYDEYLTSEGKVTCVPRPITDGDGGVSCPVDWTVFLTSEGKATCIPAPRTDSSGGQSCPIDWTLYLTSEGQATCTPTPRDRMCPIDWTLYLSSEGKSTCTPTPTNGTCPAGYTLDLAGEGRYCT